MHPPLYIPLTASSLLLHFWFYSCLNITLIFPYLSLHHCPFSVLPILCPHPTEKSLTRYVSSVSQLSVVAVNWEPQDIADPNNTKSPAFTSSDSSLCQTHTSLVGFSHTTSQLVPKQLNGYLFQIDSVGEKYSVHV